jgi:hypothetical protein
MKTRFTAMTLRLDPLLDERLTEASYECRATKADWIRSAIRHSLRIAEARKKRPHSEEK